MCYLERSQRIAQDHPENQMQHWDQSLHLLCPGLRFLAPKPCVGNGCLCAEEGIGAPALPVEGDAGCALNGQGVGNGALSLAATSEPRGSSENTPFGLSAAGPGGSKSVILGPTACESEGSLGETLPSPSLPEWQALPVSGPEASISLLVTWTQRNVGQPRRPGLSAATTERMAVSVTPGSSAS